MEIQWRRNWEDNNDFFQNNSGRRPDAAFTPGQFHYFINYSLANSSARRLISSSLKFLDATTKRYLNTVDSPFFKA